MNGGLLMSAVKDRKQYSQMSKSERKELIRNLRIFHPRFSKALRLIKECHESLAMSSDPQCMVITGESGSGKSTVFESYEKLHDKVIYGETRTKRVLLAAEIQSPVTISTFLESLLDQLGDPFPTGGTIGNKNHRLVNLIKDCGVELIMLDEFQHFVHPKNQRVNFDVADCFKSLINRTNVPVVLFGQEDSEIPIKSNAQLNRRFSIRHHLHPFDGNDLEEFRSFLNELDHALPFEELAGLAGPVMSERFYAATRGLVDSIMRIIRSAAKIAIENDKNKMELLDFAKAFNLHQHISHGKTNPFLKKNFTLGKGIKKTK
jgi:energy-coupling factor transporter ATP-binding protein EcfA2